jgi:Tfp pilus assembly protein PilF
MLLARTYAQSAVTPKDWDKPVSLYRQVLDVDPGSAPAHARLARALFLQGTDIQDAEKHARLSIQIDPTLAEAHSYLADILKSQYRHGAAKEYARAVELNPNDAEALHAYGVFLIGRFAPGPDGHEYLRRASNIDPASAAKAGDLAWSYVVGASEAEAAPYLRNLEERLPTAAGRFVLARTLGNSAGKLDQAIAWGMEARRLDPDNAEVPRDIAEWLGRLGMETEAAKVVPEPSLRILFWQRRYDEIIQRMSKVDLDDTDPDSLGYLAFAFQATGQDEEAIPILHNMRLPEYAMDADLRQINHLHQLAILFGSLNAIGETAQARKLAQWLEQTVRPGIEHDRGWGGHWWLGCALGVLGKRDEALHEIEAMVSASNSATMPPYLRDAACFRDLRDEPRYQKAVHKLQAHIDAMRERLPAALAQRGFTMDQF